MDTATVERRAAVEFRFDGRTLTGPAVRYGDVATGPKVRNGSRLDRSCPASTGPPWCCSTTGNG